MSDSGWDCDAVRSRDTAVTVTEKASESDSARGAVYAEADYDYLEAVCREESTTVTDVFAEQANEKCAAANRRDVVEVNESREHDHGEAVYERANEAGVVGSVNGNGGEASVRMSYVYYGQDS